MRRLLFFIRTAVENMQINRLMAFLSFLTLSLTLMLFGVFLLIYNNLQGVIRLMQEDVQFSIYLSDGITEEERGTIREALSNDERIAMVQYISKEEALEIFKKEFQDEALLKSLGGNPLPASFEVKVKAPYQEPDRLSRMVDRFGKFQGVEEVQYGSEWLQNLDAFLTLLKRVGIGIGGLLAVAMITIVSNTVRLHFYNRKDEIETMILMGATSGFIKIPFFIEGSLIGLVSGGISVVMLFGVFRFASTYLQSIGGILHRFLNLHFLPAPFLAGMMAGGAFLGGLAGYLALSALPKSHVLSDG
ncbi:MAG: permease-like cell division protein FtsX [Candidatus Manganitrophaceae bacterium]